jgi:hypothetical protein
MVDDDKLNQSFHDCVDKDELKTEIQFLTKVTLSTDGNGEENDKHSLHITESILLFVSI